MKNAATKTLNIDERGRITLPKELREGVDVFSVEKERDGSLRLVPQKSVSVQEAQILADLRQSVEQFKAGRTKPMPKEWLK
ncbi:MAG: hypothetical protein HY537_19000 [Deltaproteobacteria bacterium]|nr:hypothetical protein [Deltaproteobacteria bacterium]